MDIVATLKQVLTAYNLTSIAQADQQAMPLIVSSFELEDLISVSNWTDLPLVHGIVFNSSEITYDYNEIAMYAHGVKV